MGRTVRFDQIFVSNMDANPTEQDILTTVRSIITGEIEADEIVVTRMGIANTSPTKSFSIGADLFMESGQEVILDVSKTINTVRMNVADKIGVKTTNPVHDFQVGANQEFFIGTGNRDLVTVNGNILTSNLIFTNQLELDGKVKISNSDSNVIKVTGNTFTTNATVGTFLSVGNEVDPATDSNVAVFENGNVIVRNGVLRIFGDTEMIGNLTITENPAYTSVDNLVVSNAVILMGDGNNGTYDMGVLMRDGAAGTSNVFLGYTHANDQFSLTRTFGGPTTATFDSILDTSNTVNLHIYGELYTQNNVGIVNTSPTHTLSIGSNVYINDTATSSANVLHANGYGFFEGLRIGSSGLSVGNLITLDADSEIPMLISARIQTHGFQTTGVDGNGVGVPSGIANTSSTNTLSIGDKIFINTSAANLITVLGNTATGRLITQSILVQDFIEVEGESGISSAANVIIHGDISGGDSVSNTVSIRCGPDTANVSALEINGAKTSASHQSIVFKTKNTERMRVASTGYVGLSNTEPSQLLTLGGNLQINQSNAVMFGNLETSMKVYADPVTKETKVENRVDSGKGVNFYVSKTASMGTPKLTILESSNVGVGTASPQGRFHTSGGTVFINNQVVNRGPVSHLGTPLVVTNTEPIINTSDFKNVLQLTREGGTNSQDGVRAIFKMGKHTASPNTSKSQIDLVLASDSYETENNVMTWRSNRRVGIGTTAPASHFHVMSSGIGNAGTNGILVHNNESPNGDAIMSVRTDKTSGNAFTSFIQTNDGSDPAGWSMGVTGSLGDFRLTRNPDIINQSASSKFFVGGSTGFVGIGTDAPRAKLEVNGNVVIGNELYFGGLVSDEFSNTFIKERLVSTDISELLIFKGNEGPGAAGPDQLRFVGSQQVFQTYSEPQLNDVDKEAMENGTSNLLKPTMFLSAQGKVLIGTADTSKIQQTATTQLFVNGGIEFAGGQKVNFGNLDIFALSDGARFETIGAVDMRFQNKATTGTSELNATEAIRIKNTGLVGFGTATPDTNVHIYSGVTTNIDVLKLQSPGTNNKIGLSLNTNDNYGGYVRGFSNTQHSVHGTVLGAVKNSVEADGIHIINTSNVGIGTVNPSERFTVYNGTARLEHSSANAMLEFKTPGGVSNIYGDVTGNVVIDAVLDVIINSNVEISGDLQIDGKIDLGNQVAIGLSGADANTSIHINGGIITNSNEVACKRYSKKFTLTSGSGQDVQITFGPQTFYAKIVAQLRETSDVNNVSTMILEVQGGTHDGTTPSLPIAIGTKNMFSGVNLYPWNPVVTTGKRSVQIQPSLKDSGRNYAYDIFVEVMSGVGGGLTKFTYNIGNSPAVNLNNGSGGNNTLATHTY